MRVAPDVEKLMWVVAESADPQMVADFESRFPHLRYELSKRIDLVRGLKASKSIGNGPGSIPVFRPPVSASRGRGFRWQWSMAAVALSALAVGSYVVTQQFLATPAANKPMTDSRGSDIRVPLDPLEIEDPVKRTDQLPPPNPGLNETGVQPPEDEPIQIQPWLKPLTVKFERLGLANALRAVAAQAGLKLDMPPDMPNDDIVLDYRNMNAFEILADMGPRFGFTAFDQGNGNVIIVPARDEGSDVQPGIGEPRPLNPNTQSSRRTGTGG